MSGSTLQNTDGATERVSKVQKLKMTISHYMKENDFYH